MGILDTVTNMLWGVFTVYITFKCGQFYGQVFELTRGFPEETEEEEADNG